MSDRITTQTATVTHVSIGLDVEGRAVAVVRLMADIGLRSVPVSANPHNLRAIMEACGQTKLSDCVGCAVSICIKDSGVWGIGRILSSGKHTV